MRRYEFAAIWRRDGRSRRLSVVLAGVVWLAGSGAAAQPLESPDFGSGGGIRLWQDGSGWALVELADGSEISLEPSRTQYHSVVRSRSSSGDRDFWWAAGSEPTREGGQELVVVRGGSTPEPVAAPAISGPGRVRTQPVLMSGPGGVEGLVWLQGASPATFHVQSAAWRGDRFEAGDRVTGPGPGSQVALDATVLADGSWALVWAAYDGNDDEILLQRRVLGEWQKTGRLTADNDVPDVTPRIVPWGDGALVVWSRYDGRQYRARIVELVDGQLRNERWAAPSGSLYPRFSWLGSEPWLVYQDGFPKAWTTRQIVGLGEGDVAPLTATQPSQERVEPLLTRSGDEVRFLWRDASGARSLDRPLEPSPSSTRLTADR